MLMQKRNNLFIDTSGWASYLCRQDEFYDVFNAFVQIRRRKRWRFITTNYIIGELVPLLSSHYHVPREEVISLVNTIKTDMTTEVIHIDQTLDGNAWKHLEARLDKKWSLVDASSFLIMEHFDITEALTSDHHFEQAGFVRVPKEVPKRR